MNDSERAEVRRRISAARLAAFAELEAARAQTLAGWWEYEAAQAAHVGAHGLVEACRREARRHAGSDA